jgi:succinyl-diaminopimelate desuccinylase
MTATEERRREELRKRLVELTRDLILIPSTADQPEEIERCMEFVINHAEAAGALTVHRYRENGVPSTVLLPQGCMRPEVMLFAHLDVVSLPPGGAYRSTVQDGRIVGPGAGDMKGEIAILLEVFRSIHQRRPGVSLGLAVTSDEERGGDYGTRFLVDTAGLRCGVAIIPDSGSLNDIAVEEKGTVHVKIRARGPAGHSSRPWLTENPIDRILTALGRIRAYFDTFKNADEHWHPTCALTIMQTPNRMPNRIPELAEAVCDIRFPPPYTAEELLTTVRGFLDDGLELELLVSAEPSRLKPDPLFLRITEQVTGKPVRLIREHGGSDGRYLSRHDIPVIMSRPFVGKLHSQEEWIDIASMETLYRIYDAYLEAKLNPSCS